MFYITIVNVGINCISKNGCRALAKDHHFVLVKVYCLDQALRICRVLTKDHHFVLVKVYCLDQALRICLEWSSEAIYFSTHQSEVIHNKITFFKVESIVY